MRFTRRIPLLATTLLMTGLALTTAAPAGAVVGATPTSPVSVDTSANATTQVYNGNAVLAPNPYPWMTAIMNTRVDNPFGAFNCGGAVVGSHWVLTAAHCVERKRNDEIQVVPGVLDVSNVMPWQRMVVSEIHIHPWRDAYSTKHDIALLRTQAPLGVPPVALISPGRQFGLGTNGVVLGWGEDGFGGRPTGLRWGSVKVADYGDDCGDYSRYEFDSTSMFCAGGNGLSNSTDTCQGDSGGPMIIPVRGGWELAGVTSWGFSCGLPGYPGVYARVTTYLDWIRSTTSRLAPGDPIGSLDQALVTSTGVRIQGWGLDPDTTSPIQVHVYVDGRYTTRMWASAERGDIGAAYPYYGASHGFDATMNLPSGNRRVCVFAINTGAGRSNTPLGCRAVQVPDRNPFGNVDRLTRLSPSTVRIEGWTIDPDVPNDPIQVDVYVNGRMALRSTAYFERPDLRAAFPAWNSRHGINVAVGAASGSQVCVYALNVGPGSTNPLLGCRRA